MKLKTAKDGISVKEAADRTGVSLQTIYNWVHSGVLPATIFGRNLIRINPKDLDALRRETGGKV